MVIARKTTSIETRHAFSAIGFAIFIGLLSAACLNRLVGFFFYVTFISAVISGVICFLALYSLEQFSRKNPSKHLELKVLSNVLSVFLAMTITFSFLSTVPLNIDRSFSVWLLNNLDKTEKSYEIGELEITAQEFFSTKEGEINRRIQEQLRLGNLEKFDDRYFLSSKGKKLIKFNRLVALIWGLEKKYTG